MEIELIDSVRDVLQQLKIDIRPLALEIDIGIIRSIRTFLFLYVSSLNLRTESHHRNNMYSHTNES